MTFERLSTGKQGEQIAFEYLIQQGHQLRERNFRCNFGEIDIITTIEEYLVFSEIKTRKGSGGVHPSLSVTAKKIKKLRRLGEFYISQRHLMHLQPRFDVIAVQLVVGQPPIIDHIINAF